MARTRSFDEGKVLGGAMHAFRRDGYAGISIKRLERETGLTSGSIYNAYGDKDGLYRAALAFYVDGFMAQRMAVHAGPEATLDDLEGLFVSLFGAPLADGHGCLVVNTVVEFGSAPSPVAESAGRALDMVAAAMRAVLAREIGVDGAGPEADRLMLLYQGILVLSRAGRIHARFEGVVRAHFDELRKLARDNHPQQET